MSCRARESSIDNRLRGWGKMGIILILIWHATMAKKRTYAYLCVRSADSRSRVGFVSFPFHIPRPYARFSRRRRGKTFEHIKIRDTHRSNNNDDVDVAFVTRFSLSKRFNREKRSFEGLQCVHLRVNFFGGGGIDILTHTHAHKKIPFITPSVRFFIATTSYVGSFLAAAHLLLGQSNKQSVVSGTHEK